MTQMIEGLGTKPGGIGQLRHIRILGELGTIQMPLAPGTTPTLQAPDQIQTMLGLAQIILEPDTILTLQSPIILELSKNQITLDHREIHTIMVLQITKAVTTMLAPEQIQVILAPWKSQTIPELKTTLPTTLDPEVQAMPLPTGSPPSAL